jgi:hypothetical protein
MGRLKVENVGDASDGVVAVMVGDPSADAPQEIIRIAPGETALVEVRGEPGSDEPGSRVVALMQDGPWIDKEIDLMGDDGEGSQS